ncbi:helix-turn-helix transcriptional regulator [Streptomyces sp.]|uniref:helix-turn-helix domain-containing protein n=1 Tax=Streptomyces sp. TaxID=1931 RepID=UPI002F95FA1B
MTTQQRFAAWLAEEIAKGGYRLNRHGEQARFARDAGLNQSIVSRLLRGGAEPDIKTCRAIARVLGCKTTRVLAAAGLLPEDEVDEPSVPRPLAQRDYLAGLVGDDTAAQEAVIVLLRALGKWTS